jgi:hypothetical protein
MRIFSTWESTRKHFRPSALSVHANISLELSTTSARHKKPWAVASKELLEEHTVEVRAAAP